MPWVSQGRRAPLTPRPRGTLAYLGLRVGKSTMASVTKGLAYPSHEPAKVSRCCCQLIGSGRIWASSLSHHGLENSAYALAQAPAWLRPGPAPHGRRFELPIYQSLWSIAKKAAGHIL